MGVRYDQLCPSQQHFVVSDLKTGMKGCKSCTRREGRRQHIDMRERLFDVDVDHSIDHCPNFCFLPLAVKGGNMRRTRELSAIIIVNLE